MDTWSFDGIPKSIKIVSRDRLFYDRYEYGICVKLPEVSVVRNRSHASIDLELNHRQDWRGRLGSRNFGGSWRSHQRVITPEIRQNCHAFLDMIDSGSDNKTWLSQDWAYIYSNDLEFLRQIENLPYLVPVELRRAVVDQERDTVLVRSSPYSRRSYFRAYKPSDAECDALRNLLSQQQDLRLSPSLKQWVDNTGWSYVRENFFIDHNGEGIELMLALIATRPIRKTVTIKHDK